jgi:hypothetical protein
MVFPILAPPNLQDYDFELTRICTMSGSFYVNRLFWLSVSTEDWGPWSELTLICTSWGCLDVNLRFFWLSDSWEDLNSKRTPPYFPLFMIISPLKRTWPLIWKILNSLYSRMICIKFEWKWLAGSEYSLFLLFCYYLPLGRCIAIHLNNFESSFFKDDLCQVW